MSLGDVGRQLSAAWVRGGHGASSLLASQRGLSLLLWFDRPADHELEAHANSRVLIAAVRTALHTIALPYRIDGLTAGWEYVPYAPAQDADGIRALLGCPADQPWWFSVGLADCDSRTLVARREAQISHGLREVFRNHFTRMLSCAPDFSASLYKDDLDSIARRWPEPEDMLRSAEMIAGTRAIEELR